MTYEQYHISVTERVLIKLSKSFYSYTYTWNKMLDYNVSIL